MLLAQIKHVRSEQLIPKRNSCFPKGKSCFSILIQILCQIFPSRSLMLRLMFWCYNCLGSQHPSDAESNLAENSRMAGAVGVQNSWLFFSHVLHPPRPWTLRFRRPVFNHIPLHMAALAALLLPPLLWQRRARLFSAGRDTPLLHLPPSPAAYTVFPQMKANSSAAAAFLHGSSPKSLLCTGRAQLLSLHFNPRG